MDKNTKSSSKRPFKYWLRVIHRDLGILVVGITIVYALSGILLNHMNGKDPAYKSTEEEIQLVSGLDADALSAAWNKLGDLPKIKRVVENDTRYTTLMLEQGIGAYDRETGVLKYEHHKKRMFVYCINKLHYNRIGGWSIVADFFGVSLLFLAVSGLFMTSKKHGIMGRGKWFLIVGLLIPLIYIMIP